jgi:hypothetical protein
VNEKLLTIGDWFGPVGAGVAKAVRLTLSAVGRVHRMPRLRQPVPVVSDSRMREGGKYRWDRATGAPIDIRLNPRSDHRELTFALEIGHLLDHQATGTPGEFASVAHPRLAGWRKAVESSRSFQKLEDLQAAGTIPYQFGDGVTRQVQVGRIAGYLLEPPELFSRSYAQFIAAESRSAILRAQLHGFRRPENPSSVVPYYWDDDEFAALATSLQRLIIEVGWKRTIASPGSRRSRP